MTKEVFDCTRNDGNTGRERSNMARQKAGDDFQPTQRAVAFDRRRPTLPRATHDGTDQMPYDSSRNRSMQD